ncbi:MAG: HAMP domain-containing histidine kinase, partial [Leptospiraceae bacterium]|nr:HAMP domain-containing histidine kinase [Leptospiraceae bacterium]
AIKQEQESQLLQENLAALGTMISGIAHELNNPLTGMGLTLQNLAANLGELKTAEVQKRLQIVRKDLDRASRIVSDILGFASPGKMRFARSSLHQVIQKAYQNTNRLYPLLCRQVNWELENEDILIDMDVEKMERLFINLFRNTIQALDYREGTIKVTFHDSNRYVHIIVEDNAGGIAADLSKKIFQPFFTKGQNRGGTGLGLSICHSIVKEHYGNIHVRSFEKKTRFYISIPLRHQMPNQAPGDTIQ